MSFIISAFVNSSARQIRVCEECATSDAEHGILDARRGSGIADGKCPECNSRYSRSTLLGCPTCYTEFAGALKPFLHRIHGSVVHRGKRQTSNIKRQRGVKPFPYSEGQEVEKPESQRGGKSDASILSASPLPCLRALTDLSCLYGRTGGLFLPAEAEWMQGSGPDCDVVISTRIRLARNISGHVFCNLAEESELQHIAETVEDAVADIGRIQDSPLRNASVIGLEHLNAIDCEFLIERHLISRDLTERNGTGKVIVGEKEVVSIMLNEEDHIRLQVINPGLQLRQSWEMINAIDDELGQRLDYAFSANWGYLTACPTNVGTGLRVSVMLHIPALAVASGRTEGSPLRAMSDMGYAVRGMYGEGSQATGAFYQISNEATLGQSEEEIVDRIRSVARQIVDREREERRLLTEKNGVKVEDKIFRSYGTLTNARLLSSREALDLLSWVSLGISLGMIGRKEEGSQRERGSEGTRERGSGYSPLRVLASSPSSSDIARLLVLTRPAHLQKYEGRKLDTTARDISRAAVIREKLKQIH